MISHPTRHVIRLFAFLPFLLLTACGGDGGGLQSGTGEVSARITDAAVDELDAVNLRVIGIELRQDDGDSEVIDLRDPATNEPLEFNLLEYQQGATLPLFNDQRVPAGVYSNVRLVLQAPAQTPGACAGQDPLDGSHVIESGGGLVSIFVPSAANSGVKLASSFRVPVNGEADIIIDFDLRKSLHQPTGQDCYFLRPSFRVEVIENTGTIAGTVATGLLDGGNGHCSDDDPQTGNAVYVYEGAGMTLDDIDAVDDGVESPYATSAVTLNSGNGQYEYRAAFLPPGDYTVAFTCKADLERIPDPDGATDDDVEADDDLDFQSGQDAAVIVQQTTTIDFTP